MWRRLRTDAANIKLVLSLREIESFTLPREVFYVTHVVLYVFPKIVKITRSFRTDATNNKI